MMTLLQMIRNNLWTAESSQAKYVCPIFGVDEKDKPSLVGSGVLLSVGYRHFLVTAAHVLDENKKSTLYFAGNDSLIALISENSYRTNSPTGDRKDDKHDIAYMELDDKYVDQSKRYEFLQVNATDPNDIPTPHKLYCYIGFPHSKTSVIPDLKKVKPKIYSYADKSEGTKTYQTMGFYLNTHTIISFDKAKVKTFDGKIQTFPDPWGMSGGGVWRVADVSNLRTGSFQPILVGIATEYHQKEKVLVSTKISFALEALRRNYADLDNLIPRCSILRINIR